MNLLKEMLKDYREKKRELPSYAEMQDASDYIDKLLEEIEFLEHLLTK
jgi:hypothetical protein